MAPIEFYDQIDLKGNRALEVGDPTLDDDGANKRYVDQQLNLRDWKQSVRVAAATNVNVAAPGASVDGVALSVGQRLLLRGQTAGAENGIYTYQGAATPLTRTADALDGTVLTAAAVVAVEEGTSADQLWQLTTDNPIVVGTTVQTWQRLGGAKFATLVGDGSTQTIPVVHNLNTRNVHVTVYRNSALFSEVYPDVRHTDANTVTVRFTPAPAVNEFMVVIS